MPKSVFADHDIAGSLRDSVLRDGALVIERVPVRDPSFVDFLAAHRGGPRGFWRRSSGWVAHAGYVARLIHARGAAGSADSSGGESAFRRMADAVAALSEGPLSRERWYGGFSFEAERNGSPWTEFPAARFDLPALELMWDGERGWLTGRTAAGDDPEAARSRLIERLGSEADRVQDVRTAPSAPLRTSPDQSAETNGSREAWRQSLSRASEAFGTGELEKVVLARSLRIGVGHAAQADVLAARLLARNPSAHVFAFEPVVGHVFAGASPEVLADVRGDRLRATAVAGSAARGGDPEQDRARAEALMASDKDRREQALVVRDMTERLASISEGIRPDPDPHLLTLPTLFHLESRVAARLRAGVHVFDVLERLHPTPAVCGVPRDEARSFLIREEGFSRGWYGGPVGWFDGRGDGFFVPALRCVLGVGDDRWLFAGAGIVPGSEADREWEEIELKFGTALSALDAPDPPR